MRVLGYVLLFGGFIWLGYDAASGFTEYQYAKWVGYSQRKLPPGDTIAKRDAVGAMHQLCLDLKDRHRVVMFPGVLMLFGGLLIGSPKPNPPPTVD